MQQTKTVCVQFGLWGLQTSKHTYTHTHTHRPSLLMQQQQFMRTCHYERETDGKMRLCIKAITSPERSAHKMQTRRFLHVCADETVKKKRWQLYMFLSFGSSVVTGFLSNKWPHAQFLCHITFHRLVFFF